MPEIQKLGRVPLVPSINPRGIINADDNLGKDQQLIGGIVSIATNPFTNMSTAYVEKLPTFAELFSSGTVTTCTACHSSTFFQNTGAFGGTNSAIYTNGSLAGTITGTVVYFTEAKLGGVAVLLIPSTDGTGWYIGQGAQTQSVYVGDTHSNTTIDNIASTAGMYVGQPLIGSGIVVGTRIASIVGPTSITITIAATATAAGVSITKTALAKIIDPNFPSIVGAMVELDGFIFAMTLDGNIRHSALNNLNSWPAANSIAVNQASGVGVTVQKLKNFIVGMTTTDIEFFYNAGNSSGSVLSRSGNMTINIGVHSAGSGNNTKVTSSARDRVCFVSAPQGQTCGAYMLEGNTAVKISTSHIDSIFAKSSAGEFVLYQFTLGGQDFLYAGSGTTFYFYSFTTKFWTVAGWANGYVFNEHAHGLVSVIAGSTTAVGKLYSISDTATFTSDPTLDIRFSDNGFGVADRKTVLRVELVADTQASGTTTLAVGDDAGNYTTLGTFDMTTESKTLHRGSTYKGHRMWKLTNSAATPCRVQFLDFYGYVS